MNPSTLFKRVEERRQKLYEELRKKDIQEYYKEKTLELINLRGIKRKAISEALGINRNSLYKWLKGDFNLTQERLDKLENLINLFEK